MIRVVLMVVLGVVEALQRHNLGHDPAGKHMGRVQLRDIGLADLALVIVAQEIDDRYDVPTSGPWRFSCVGSCATLKKCAATARR